MPRKRKRGLMTPEEGLELLRPVDAIARRLLAKRLGVRPSDLADYTPYATRFREEFADLFSADAADPRRGS